MAKNRYANEKDIPKAKINKESLQKASRLFNYMEGDKAKFGVGFVFLFFTAGTALAFPYFLGNLIKATSLSNDEINNAGLLLLGLLLIQGISSYFRVYLFTKVTENMLSRIREAVYSNLIKQPMNFFTQRRVGELNSRISADISQIHDTFTTNLAELIRQLIIIVGGITFLFFMNAQLALVMLAIVPVVAVLAFIFGRYVRKFSRNVQDKIADSNTIVEETLQGVQNVKAFANEFYEIIRYGKSVDTVRELAVKLGRVRGAFYSFIITIMMGSLVFLLWYSLKQIHAGNLKAEELGAFALLTIFIAGSFGGIIEQYSQFQRALGATDRVLELLDEKPEEIDTEIEKIPSEFRLDGSVEFINVGFNYPSRVEFDVLKDISLAAKAGERIAVVGPSGAGKSTLVSLLLRFYDPQKGEILFDGKPSTRIPLTYLRRQMAIVPQDVFLFGGTIKENILYGKHNATEAEIVEAAKRANAHNFIMSFPEGYETVVGERGVKLSGGQRQRIAIARAVLKDPAILLLDEATSSLDSESEKLVQEALEELMKGRTSFIIAHRLSTIRNADKIIVIDGGKVVESGNHNELIQHEGLYKKLSAMQFREEAVSI
ncbi:MAG TPA: ABC transporter transmembrane domain-containing protein [Bacteroidia bacterium]|nr:ABC transporter transmembrane domain-containing protein [Bacteroidia bacterium]